MISTSSDSITTYIPRAFQRAVSRPLILKSVGMAAWTKYFCKIGGGGGGLHQGITPPGPGALRLDSSESLEPFVQNKLLRRCPESRKRIGDRILDTKTQKHFSRFCPDRKFPNLLGIFQFFLFFLSRGDRKNRNFCLSRTEKTEISV